MLVFVLTFVVLIIFQPLAEKFFPTAGTGQQQTSLCSATRPQFRSNHGRRLSPI